MRAGASSRSAGRALAGAGHGRFDDLDVDAADQASNSADMGIQSCGAVIDKDAYRKRITMTTSDPVLYPLPQTDVESMRQDAARARLDLADTVEALAARLNVRRQVFRKIRSSIRRTAPAWAATTGVASVVVFARLAPPGPRPTRRRRWAAGGVATTVGVLAYVAIDRRYRPNRPADDAWHGAAIEPGSPATVSAPPIRAGAGGPGRGRPRPGARDLRDRAGAGAGLHRAARRPVGRAAGREGHRRQDRRRPAAPQGRPRARDPRRDPRDARRCARR